jgi:hypothetical protein
MAAFLLDKGFSSALIDETVSTMSAEIATDNEQVATKKAAIAARAHARARAPSESDGISTGVIVGIAIGILVFVAIIAIFACKPSKKSNAGTPEAGSVVQTKVVVAQQPESNV